MKRTHPYEHEHFFLMFNLKKNALHTQQVLFYYLFIVKNIRIPFSAVFQDGRCFYVCIMCKDIKGLPSWYPWKRICLPMQETTCDVGDMGSIPGLGRSPEEEMGTLPSILTWQIP